MPPALVLAILLAAFWESWRWLVQRTWATPDEAITLVVMVCVVAGSAAQGLRRSGRLQSLALLPLAVVLAAYAATLGKVPAIVSAAAGVMTTLAAIYVSGHGRRPPVAFWGLCCLVLPIVPTLQFYLGYPMRVVSAVLTLPLLQLNGLDVALAGTALVFDGRQIQFDAPCSGVTMAWAGMLLVFSAATLHDYDWRGLAWAALLGLRLLLAANVLRAASLFYLETGILPGNSEAMHQAVGLSAFALAMGLLVVKLRSVAPCQS